MPKIWNVSDWSLEIPAFAREPIRSGVYVMIFYFRQGKRDEVKEHLENTTEEHLHLVHETLGKQQKCLEAQSESIQLQKEHIKLQRDALSSYKNDLLELRSKFADGELVWKISQFGQKLRDAKTLRSTELLVSEPFYTHKNGYKMCAGLWINGFGSGKGKYISVGLQVRTRRKLLCTHKRSVLRRQYIEIQIEI